jgi:hypothetical protein
MRVLNTHCKTQQGAGEGGGEGGGGQRFRVHALKAETSNRVASSLGVRLPHAGVWNAVETLALGTMWFARGRERFRRLKMTNRLDL